MKYVNILLNVYRSFFDYFALFMVFVASINNGFSRELLVIPFFVYSIYKCFRRKDFYIVVAIVVFILSLTLYILKTNYSSVFYKNIGSTIVFQGEKPQCLADGMVSYCFSGEKRDPLPFGAELNVDSVYVSNADLGESYNVKVLYEGRKYIVWGRDFENYKLKKSGAEVNYPTFIRYFFYRLSFILFLPFFSIFIIIKAVEWTVSAWFFPEKYYKN